MSQINSESQTGSDIPSSTRRLNYDAVPLPTSSTSAATHIRLIELLPPMSPGSSTHSTFSSPLRCQIRSVALESHPPFTALSYTWGRKDAETDKQLDLFLSGSHDDTKLGQLTITFSLNEALQHIRHPSDRLTLWIDQICINQEDDTEKGLQVAAMGRIYSQAERVLIWLGPGTPESDHFIDKMTRAGLLAKEVGLSSLNDDQHKQVTFLNSVAAIAAQMHGRQGSLSGTAVASPDDMLGNIAARAEAQLVSNEGDESLTLILKWIRTWFHHPWFTRVWVLQEYALAREAEFLIGQKGIDSDVFSFGVRVLWLDWVRARRRLRHLPSAQQAEDRRSQLDALMHALRSDPLEVFAELRRQCQAFPGRSGETLCELVRHIYGAREPDMGATLNRDRLYALLPLARDADRLKIAPDYSPRVTTAAVYTRVTRKVINSGLEGIYILELVRFPKVIPGEDEAAARLPSWVPDFMHPKDSISTEGQEWFYSPTGKLRQRVVDTDDENIICLMGAVVDVVEGSGTLWERACPDLVTDLSNWLTWHAEIKTMLRRSARFEGADSQRIESTSLRISLGDVGYDSTGRARRATQEDLDSLSRIIQIPQINSLLEKEEPEEGRAVSDQLEIAGAEPSIIDALRPKATTDKQRQAIIQAYLSTLHERVPQAMSVAAMLRLIRRLGAIADNMRPFLTRDSGNVGMGPLSTTPGDVVVLIHGARMPYMLRPRRDLGDNHYEFLGEVYCDGIMDGEAAGLEARKIYLV